MTGTQELSAKARIGVLVGSHGRGSNMRALVEKCRSGHVPGEVVVVIAPRSSAPAVSVAQSLGIPVETPAPDAEFSRWLVDLIAAYRLRWLCLAGYMRLLPPEVLAALPGHVVNIHPALLPKFGGKGMWGMRVHQAVLDAGEKESGCTVHLVDERYDEGPIILQKRCPVFENDTPETLAERVLALEHEAYAEAMKRLIEAESGSGTFTER